MNKNKRNLIIFTVAALIVGVVIGALLAPVIGGDAKRALGEKQNKDVLTSAISAEIFGNRYDDQVAGVAKAVGVSFEELDKCISSDLRDGCDDLEQKAIISFKKDCVCSASCMYEITSCGSGKCAGTCSVSCPYGVNKSGSCSEAYIISAAGLALVIK